MEKILKKTWVKSMAPFGSRVVGCATEKSDYDYLVLVDCKPTLDDMKDTNFLPDAEDPLYGIDFSSWRFGDINLVFTNSEGYYRATLEACEFCKKYKVYDKKDRCEIHHAYRDALKFRLQERCDFLSIFPTSV